MIRIFLFAFGLSVGLFLIPGGRAFSQDGGMAINNVNTPPDGSAMLDVQSTTKGMLVPRMSSSQRNAINTPATGLLVYQTDSPAGYYYYTGTNWIGIEGVGEGAISSSSCIDYDGNAYLTVTIGTQTWMAENLRVLHYRNGDAIAHVTDNGAWAALTSGAYCWYGNDQATYAKYGAMYNWYAVDDPRGLCPEGYHEPTDAEWTILATYLGGQSVAGGKMKSVSALWNSPNVDAANSSGFSGLPGGERTSSSGTFQSVGNWINWWTSTESSSSQAWCRWISRTGSTLFPDDIPPKGWGMNVRCLRD